MKEQYEQITIGNNCFVGANSVVTFDLVSNTAVLGAPGQIIRKVINIKMDRC